MLLSRKYIVGHILVVMIVVACFALSSWQFDRLNERKKLNERISASMKREPVELSSLIKSTNDLLSIKEYEYRPVGISGTYRHEGEVLITGRSRQGEPGYNVATPFIVSGSPEEKLVYVNRGWIPQKLGDDVLEGKSSELITPNKGYDHERRIEGLIRVNEVKRVLGSDKQVKKSEPISARLSSDLFVDISGSDKKDIYPMYIYLQDDTFDKNDMNETTRENAYPRLLDDPELTERNHLSYAIQWVLFGFVAMGTWSTMCLKAWKPEHEKRVIQ